MIHREREAFQSALQYVDLDVTTPVRLRVALNKRLLVCEVSGLLLCFRKGPIPPAAIKSVSPSPGPYLLQQQDLRSPTGNAPLRPAPTIDAAKRLSSERAAEIAKWSTVGAQTGASLARQASRTLRMGSHGVSASYRTIEDIPFRLNSQFASTALPSQFTLPNITILTPDEIRHQFEYDFTLEREYLASTDDMQEETRITRRS
ncbi:hypothetical protein BV898_19759 [Hypsibius exemplaris]|uniref:UMA domain-containing protein n=1 Tax=Hypsibius exemplaris TaxID=2072580 RepID=A0A9X6NJU8_HYPEX|nr:hypothetical protein BV898_19759 [Hypsibius exemplaris]